MERSPCGLPSTAIPPTGAKGRLLRGHRVRAGGFLSRSILLAFQSRVAAVFWFTAQSLERNIDDKEHWFGLIHPDYTPRPAYWALKALRRAYPAGRAVLRDCFQFSPAYCFD